MSLPMESDIFETSRPVQYEAQTFQPSIRRIRYKLKSALALVVPSSSTTATVFWATLRPHP
jgi:hypothetical protein